MRLEGKMGMYVITHKYMEKEIKLPNGYKWLYVGAHKQCERKAGYLFDDDGNNISVLNDRFCELTGLYWIRHNSNEKTKGLTHYRRFFTHNPLSENKKYYFTVEEIEKMLDLHDCIVASRIYFPDANIAEHYNRAHYKKDLMLLKETILEVAPDYIDAYNQAFSEKYLFPYNMIIAHDAIFCQYCDWLFNILFELQKKDNVSSYNQYQGRIYGFLAERLLHVWLIHNNVNYKELPVVQLGSSLRYRVRICLERLVKQSIYFKIRRGVLCQKK